MVIFISQLHSIIFLMLYECVDDLLRIMMTSTTRCVNIINLPTDKFMYSAFSQVLVVMLHTKTEMGRGLSLQLNRWKNCGMC